MLDVHVDFSAEIDIGYDVVKGFTHPDAETCKERLQTLKVNMFHVMLRWERSGAGDCGLLEVPEQESPEGIEDEDCVPAGDTHRRWGHISSYRHTSDNRASFLWKHEPSYLLYYWNLLEQNDLLSTALQKLDQKVALDNGGVDMTSLNYTPSAAGSSLTANVLNQGGRNAAGVSDAMVLERFDNLIGVIRTNQEAAFEQEKIMVIQSEASHRRLAVKDRIDHLKLRIRPLKRKYERTGCQEDLDDLTDIELELQESQQELASLNEDLVKLSDSHPARVVLPGHIGPPPQFILPETPIRDNRTPR